MSKSRDVELSPSSAAADAVRQRPRPGCLRLAGGGRCQCDSPDDVGAAGPTDLQRLTRALVDHAERARAWEGQHERLLRCCARLELRLRHPARTVQ